MFTLNAIDDNELVTDCYEFLDELLSVGTVMFYTDTIIQVFFNLSEEDSRQILMAWFLARKGVATNERNHHSCQS